MYLKITGCKTVSYYLCSILSKKIVQAHLLFQDVQCMYIINIIYYYILLMLETMHSLIIQSTVTYIRGVVIDGTWFRLQNNFRKILNPTTLSSFHKQTNPLYGVPGHSIFSLLARASDISKQTARICPLHFKTLNPHHIFPHFFLIFKTLWSNLTFSQDWWMSFQMEKSLSKILVSRFLYLYCGKWHLLNFTPG